MNSKQLRALNLLSVVAMLMSLLLMGAPLVQAAPESVSVVSITNPAANAKVPNHAGGSFTVQYTFTQEKNYKEQDVTAEFYLGDVKIGTASIAGSGNVCPTNGGCVKTASKTLTIPANTAAGLYSVKVTAKENQDANWQSAQNDDAILIDNTPPAVNAATLIKPNGYEVWESEEWQQIVWDAVQVAKNTDLPAKPITLFLSCDGGANWHYQIDGALANTGVFDWHIVGFCATLQARVKLVVTDLAGNTASDMSDFNFQIFSEDHTPPVVTLTAPTNGSYVKGTLAVTANAYDDDSGIAKVTFSLNDAFLADVTVPVSPATPPTPGTYKTTVDTTAYADGTKLKFCATATNGVGGVGTAPACSTVTVDNSAPTVAITYPVEGQVVNGMVMVKATAADPHSGIASVQFQYSSDGVTWINIDGADTSSPYEKTWDTSGLAEGPYKLRAIATNGAGITATSVVVNVIVSHEWPSFTYPVFIEPTSHPFICPAPAASVWELNKVHRIEWDPGSIHGAYLGPTPISIYAIAIWPEPYPGPFPVDPAFLEPVLVAKDLPLEPGYYDWNVTGILAGDYVMKMVVTDLAGHQSAAFSCPWEAYIKDTTLPTVAMTAPAAGAVLSDTIKLSAIASDPESGIYRVGFQWSSDGTTWNWVPGLAYYQPGNGNTYSLNWNSFLAHAPDGFIWLRAQAQNGVGNWNASEAIKITIDNSPPVVKLIQPNDEVTISGQAFNLYATAEDPTTGVKQVTFWYMHIDRRFCIELPRPNSLDEVVAGGTWVKIGDGAPSGRTNEYTLAWDTSKLDDGCYWVMVTATNNVNLTSWDLHRVYIFNHWTIHLRKGWNLVSTPLIPYNTAIADVLKDLDGVRQVVNFCCSTSGLVQKSWAPVIGGSLTNFVDGKGYLIEMAKTQDLVITGAPLPSAPNPAGPPSYAVYTGWNMIGFTPNTIWPEGSGRFTDEFVGEYLGPAVTGIYQQMYWFDAWDTGLWQPISPRNVFAQMEEGYGYWLATSANGVIYP